MARFVELERGVWIEGLNEEVKHEAEALCGVMEGRVVDAVLSLAMFERDSALAHASHDAGQWESDRDLERHRQEELEAEEATNEEEWYGDRMTRLYERARRDVVRAKWESGELPRSYTHRLPFLHARSFMTSLAQLGRALSKVAMLDTGEAQTGIETASNSFDAALPHLKPVRDSIEHAEDRMRGLNRDGEKLTLAPVSNQMVHAPGGGVLIGDALNGRNYGCTVNDGAYAEVEVSDDTVEVARAAVQGVFDALPWLPGHRHFMPSQ